jgi:poly-beta-1,6-N-acetyl-D-glucosamine biosynthesis protein PgaD
MKKIALTVVFGIMVFLVWAANSITFAAMINWNNFFQTMVTRLGTERIFAGILLIFYLLMAIMVVISFGRWMLEFAREIVVLAQSILTKKQTTISEQTLDNTLIINNPKLKKPAVRFIETLFSVAVWLFFVYLFQTILTTFMWVFGLEKIYHFNFSVEVIEGTLDALVLILYTALTCIVVLFAWAQWNYWRFGRLERRKSRPAVRNDEVATFFSLPLSTVYRIQNSKIAFILPIADNAISFHEKKMPY